MRASRDSNGRLTPGAGLAIGIGLGTALGVAMGKLAIGVAIGVALGLVLGVAYRGRRFVAPEVDDDDDS